LGTTGRRCYRAYDGTDDKTAEVVYPDSDGQLAMFDGETGKRLLSDDEAAAEAERRLAEANATRKTLEDEVARLRSERR
jgi:hypothetical protein